MMDAPTTILIVASAVDAFMVTVFSFDSIRNGRIYICILHYMIEKIDIITYEIKRRLKFSYLP